jgi:hypothetical protein
MKLLDKPSLEFGPIFTHAEATRMDIAPFSGTAKNVRLFTSNPHLQ